MGDITIQNFILHKEQALSKEICERFIQDGINELKAGANNFVSGEDQYPNKRLSRHDYQLFLPSSLMPLFPYGQQAAFEAFEDYRQEISSVASETMLVCNMYKWQHTPVSGGYYQWHCEQGQGTSANRLLVWSIYLNDVEEGGETEFLYQGLRFKPRQGDLLMWPSGLTHPHRGNPPYSNDKYIITGWIEWPNVQMELPERQAAVNSDPKVYEG